jgi:FkbM family methyltransferase
MQRGLRLRGILGRLRLGRVPAVYRRTRELSPSRRALVRLWWRLGAGFFEPYFSRLRSGEVSEIEITAGGERRAVRLRANGADTFTFYEIFIKRVYDACLPLPRDAMIIDAGANIGLASLFFKSHAPEARIVAIEPEHDNFDLLLQNVPDETVVAYRAALWAESGEAAIHVGGPTGHRVGRAETPGDEGEMIPALTLDDIADLHAPGNLDLIKVDIEGAEAEVFRRSWACLERTHTVVMEIHVAGVIDRIAHVLGGHGLLHMPPAHPEFPHLFRRAR